MPKKTKDVQYYEAVGRRKQSVARVRLHLARADAAVDAAVRSSGRAVIQPNSD